MPFGGAVASRTASAVSPLVVSAAPRPAKPEADATAAAASDSTAAVTAAEELYPQQLREVRGASSDCWDTVTVFLGTDVYKRRILCIRASPVMSALSSAVAGVLGKTGAEGVGGVFSWLTGSGAGPADASRAAPLARGGVKAAATMHQQNQSPFESAILTLVMTLVDALDEERLSAARVGEGGGGLSSYHSQSIEDVRTDQLLGGSEFNKMPLEYRPPPSLLSSPPRDEAGSKAGIDSLVDPFFVRDLMGSYAQELRFETISSFFRVHADL